MTEPARVPTQCDQCGQTDTHPKYHIANGLTKHYDCLSFSERQALIESYPKVEQVVTAAEGGTHGDDLVAHIQTVFPVGGE